MASITIEWNDTDIKSRCSKGVDRAKLLEILREIIEIEEEDEIKKNQPAGS
jgi:hypothetical protein